MSDYIDTHGKVVPISRASARIQADLKRATEIINKTAHDADVVIDEDRATAIAEMLELTVYAQLEAVPEMFPRRIQLLLTGTMRKMAREALANGSVT